ncbi:MAG: ABC transporter permease [Trueperaceae bacterium]|nr:ABC transporter permease [Trueperaceae bacterium]
MSLAFLIHRLVQLIVVTFVIALTVFAVLRLTPGDPVELMMGRDEAVTQADIDRKRRALGLDRPLHVQFIAFVGGLVTGDLGMSLVQQRPVATLLRDRLPATIELAVAAMIVSFVIGIPVGVVAALKQNSAVDRLIMSLNFVGLSLPSFWQGIMLILLFGVVLGWLPSLGRISFDLVPARITGLYTVDALLTLDGRALQSALAHLVLPALTAGTAYAAIIARVVRSSMLEVMRQDYIRTAWSKGLRPRRIVFGHALRNALIPMITIAGLEAGSLLSGSVVIETVFSWPGLGRMVVQSIQGRDYALVQGAVVLLCVLYVMISLVVDVAYSIVDPRVRW